MKYCLKVNYANDLKYIESGKNKGGLGDASTSWSGNDKAESRHRLYMHCDKK